MEYTDDITTFEDLKNTSWSGALQRLETMEENGLEDEFMEYLEEVFYDETPTRVQINDFIWFECDDWIESHTEGAENDD